VLAPDIHHTGLRTNGGAVEIIRDSPFMLSIVEAFLGFSAEIKISPDPSLQKRGELFLSTTSPFEKGGLRGIF